MDAFVGVALLAIVAGQLLIGVAVSRHVVTEADYLVAGRRLGFPLAAVSIFATWFGAESCVGAAALAYSDGLGRTSVEPFAYGVCLLLTGLVFAAPLWRRGVMTTADFLHDRFSPRVERVAALMLIPTSVLWAAAQVRAFGQVLSSSTGMDVEVAIALAGAVAVVYTGLGGLLADAMTDVVQALVLVVGLVVVLVAVLASADGWSAARLVLAGGSAHAASTGVHEVGWLATLEAWAIPLCGSVVAQEVLSRTLSSRSAAVARRAALAGGTAYLAVGAVPVALGVVGASMMPGLEDPEQLVPLLARTHLPALGYVVFAGALISAILSTVDSALLGAASYLSRNLVYARSSGASDARRLRTARAGVVVFGAVACVLAMRAEGVFALVEEASGFGSAGVLVVMTFGLFTHVGGEWSGLAALLAGIVVWSTGAYVTDAIEYPYLASLVAALGAYVLAAGGERTVAPRRCPCLAR